MNKIKIAILIITLINTIGIGFLIYASLGNVAWNKQNQEMLCSIAEKNGAFSCPR